MIDRNAEAKATAAPVPQPVARPETLAQPYPLGVDEGRRDADGVASRPMAASLCDEIYEGRNYCRRPGDDARG